MRVLGPPRCSRLFQKGVGARFVELGGDNRVIGVGNLYGCVGRLVDEVYVFCGEDFLVFFACW